MLNRIYLFIIKLETFKIVRFVIIFVITLYLIYYVVELDMKAYAEQLDQISQISEVNKSDVDSSPDKEEKFQLTLTHHILFTGCVIIMLCIIEFNK